jgi:hypothetical protein
MRSQPRNETGLSTQPKGPSSRILAACCLAVSLLVWPGVPAHAAQPRVTVSKSAASLPGPVYSWFPMPKVLPIESDPRVADAKFRGQLQAALDKALQAKGYRLAAAGAKPDFIMAYRVGVRDVTQTTVDESAGSSAPQSTVQCGSEGCSQIVISGNNGAPQLKVESESSVEGGLLIEALEPGTVRVLWRALNRGTVKPGALSQERLDTVARSTLAQLPAAGH